MSLLSPSWPVCGGIAVAAFLVGGSAAWTYKGAKLETCEVKLSAVGRDLTAQTDANDALRDLGDQARKKAADGVAATKPAADAAKARREAISARPAPGSCDAAFAEWDAK